MEPFAYACLVASAFAAAFSLPVARGFLVLSTIALTVECVRNRRRLRMPPVAWAALVFIAIAVVATVQGVHPELGVPRLRKLIWFAAIPVAATLVSSPSRLQHMLISFAFGTAVLAFHIFTTVPIQALAKFRAHASPDFGAALIDSGSMTDAQRLLLGILVTLGLVTLSRRERRHTTWWWLLLAIQGLALVMMFKRGSWICVVVLGVTFVASKMNWRYLLVFLIVPLLTLSPQVRNRFSAIRNELSSDRGGRLTMWLKVTPGLVRKYPWGIGYRSLTNEMMREVAPEVEPQRDHLHSNVCQILVATGWLGLASYLLWMAMALLDGVRFAWLTRRGPPTQGILSMVLLLMLTGLLANGLVEYNFGDSEIVLIYGILMGITSEGLRRVVAASPNGGTLQS